MSFPSSFISDGGQNIPDSSKGQKKHKDLTHGLSIGGGVTSDHSKSVLRILSALGEGAVGIPALKSVAQIGLEVVTAIENIKTNKDTCQRLSYKIERIVESTQSALTTSRASSSHYEALTKRIEEVTMQLAQVLKIVTKIKSRNSLKRVFHNSEDLASLDECDRITDNCLGLLSVEFQATGHATLTRIENVLAEIHTFHRQHQAASSSKLDCRSSISSAPSVTISMPTPHTLPSPATYPTVEYNTFDGGDGRASLLEVPDRYCTADHSPLRPRATSSPSPPSITRRPSQVGTAVDHPKRNDAKEQSKSSRHPRSSESEKNNTSSSRDRRSESEGKYKGRSSPSPSPSTRKSKPSSNASSNLRPPSRDSRPRSAPPSHPHCSGCPSCSPYQAHYPTAYYPHHHQMNYTQGVPYPYVAAAATNPYPQFHPIHMPIVAPPAMASTRGPNLSSAINNFVQASLDEAFNTTAQNLASTANILHRSASGSSGLHAKSRRARSSRSRPKTRRQNSPSSDEEDSSNDDFDDTD